MAVYKVLNDQEGGQAVLTSETAAARYGMPVLSISAEDVQGGFGTRAVPFAGRDAPISCCQAEALIERRHELS